MSNTVLITGANRGIGLALVETFLANGDQVIAVCRQSSTALKNLAVTIIDDIDVSDASDIQRLKKTLSNKAIDIIINNAGILRRSSLAEPNFDDISLQFEVNAVAPLRVAHALTDNVAKGGKLVMITSRMGSVEDNSSGGSYGYRMSKSALNAAGKSLAIDLEPRGIAVALLHPGYVKTEMVNLGGEISPELSAKRLFSRIEALSMANSGSFWHANGEELPW